MILPCLGVGAVAACPRAASGIQSRAGKSSRPLGSICCFLLLGSNATGAGLACGPWCAGVLAVTGTGTLPGLPHPLGTQAMPIQGHREHGREQVPIVKGLPGMAAPGSPVYGKGGTGKWDTYLWFPTAIRSALLTCGMVCLGAGTAHLCCARLREATSLKGDV